jgi:hypothetical protein
MRQTNLPLNLYTPDAPMAPGKWYWRTRVHGAPAWPETREFLIGEGLPSIPVPDTERLLRRLRAAGRPRLFVTAASLPELRKSLTGSRRASWRQLEPLLAAARKATGAEPTMPPGARGTHAATADAFFRARTYAAQVTEQAQLLSLAYLLRGEPADGDAAKRVALAISAWDPDGPSSRRAHDAVFRMVLEALTRTYDWLGATDLLTERERRQIETAVARRARDLREWHRESRPHAKWPYESHVSGSLGYCGELGVSFAGVLPDAADWLAYYLTMMTAHYPAYGIADGSWHEGPGYWKWTMGSHVPAAYSVSQALGLDLLRHPYLANTGDFKLYADPPWAELSPFGDAVGSNPGSLDAAVMAKLAAVTGKPRYAWYAGALGRGPRIETAEDFLLLGDPPAAVPPDSKLPLARIFPDTGLAVLRTNLTDPGADIQFMIKSSPFGSVSHGHPDQGGFYLAAYGKALAIPSGYYGANVGALYGDPHHASWMWQSWAHNVPLVDGIGQGARTAEAAGRIEHFYHSAVVDHVRVDATLAYRAASSKSALAALNAVDPALPPRSGSAPVESYRRSAVFVRPSVIVIYDELRATRPVRLDWLLHAIHPMRLGESSIHVENSEARLDVRILAKAKFSQTDRFFVAPYKKVSPQWHATAALESVSADHRVVTVLLPHRAGEQPPSTSPVNGAAWTGVEIRRGAETTTVAFAKNRELELSGVRAEARAVVVHRGARPWVYASDATRLSVNQRTHTYDSPADVLIEGAGYPVVSRPVDR